ncbi:MAG TPA: hypothetical protein VGK15_03590 [Candidatus Limnocylindria bacterium]
MSARAIAWTLWAVGIGFAAAGLALLTASFGVPLPDSWGFRGFTAIFAVTFGTLGAFIVGARRSRIGWLLLAAGVLSGIQCFGEEYAIYGIVARPGSLPAAAVLGWINSWIWVIIVALVAIFVPLLFPSGDFLSPRWRLAGIATVAAAAYLGTTLALQDGPLNNAPFVENPFGLPGLKVLDVRTGSPGPAFILGYGGMIGCAAAAIASVVVRFRSSRGIERQQLKMFAFSGGILVLGFMAGAGLQEHGKVGQLFFISSLQVVPFAVAVAVLRYRLYDIDVLINRALVYGTTTAAIAIAFFAGIVVLQAALRPFTGGSELAVAASTLVCFALFQPIRRRMQSTVDRRFYRARYDAAVTLDRFTSALAGEVDLAAVREGLLDAVGETVRPAHASVWLR